MAIRLWEDPEQNRPVLPTRFFGFTEAAFHGVLRRAYREADFTTLNHPVSYPGQKVWGESHAALREQGILLGGTRCDKQGIPKAVSPDQTTAITVVAGNEHTGSRFHTPKTKRPRQVAGLTLIVANSQFSLFGGPTPTTPTTLPTDRKTWYLLHHRHGNKVYCEVSLPDGVDAHGFVVSWTERILLAVLDLDERPTDGDAPETPVIVPVTRRG